MFNYRIQSLYTIILFCCSLTWTSSHIARGEVRLPEDEEEMHSENDDSIIRDLTNFGGNFNKDCQEYLLDRRERSNNDDPEVINNPEEADESLIKRSYNHAAGGEEVLKNSEVNKNSSSNFFRGIENFFHHLKPNATSKLSSTSIKPEELQKNILQANENVKQQKIRNLMKNKISVKSDRRATFDFQIKAVPINNKRSLV